MKSLRLYCNRRENEIHTKYNFFLPFIFCFFLLAFVSCIIMYVIEYYTAVVSIKLEAIYSWILIDLRINKIAAIMFILFGLIQYVIRLNSFNDLVVKFSVINQGVLLLLCLLELIVYCSKCKVIFKEIVEI